MKKFSFLQSLYNSALYFNGQGTYVAVYVNDLQNVGPDLSLINELKAQLALKFKTIDLGPTANYLEMKVSRDSDTITVRKRFILISYLKPIKWATSTPYPHLWLNDYALLLLMTILLLTPRTSQLIKNSREVCNGWLVRPALTFSKSTPNWATITWNPLTNARAQFLISYVT